MRSEISDKAKRLGLYMATWSPGDGKTRYRFFASETPKNYDQGGHIFTALGLREAEIFLEGYDCGRDAGWQDGMNQCQENHSG